jgi:hypothetical protein
VKSIVHYSLCALLFAVSGCATRDRPRKEFDSPAYRPTNPERVRVKVSLKNQAIYVLDGDRPLLVTATCVGKATSPTPKGTFTIFSKQAKRRANTYGFWIHDGKNQIVPEKLKNRPAGSGWRFKGYPMGYWCEFLPAYGIHAGWVHPVPRSLGCLRLHRNVAPKFFALVRVGTKVHIADSHPEDATIGKNLARPQDYNDPEFPPEILFTDRVFESAVNTPLFENASPVNDSES